MELLLKIGGSQDPKHWRDGQIIDIRPDGFHNGDITRKHHCVLTLPGDFWQFRGTTNWKWSGQKVYDNIKKYLVAVDSKGKYPWEYTTKKAYEKRLRRRDWFIDYKMLLDLGLITRSQFNAIYNKEKDPGAIFIERAFDQIVRHEDQHQRLSSKHSLAKGSITSGTYSIGSGLNYETVTAFEADIILPGDGFLTGNLTGEHANEQTAIASDVVFDVKTATYLLKLIAASGAEHNGGAYGNGARILYSASDSLKFDESVADTLKNLEVSKLALDCGAADPDGIDLYDCGDSGLCTINRCLIASDGTGDFGIQVGSSCENALITNNIIYQFNLQGITSWGLNIDIYNNTIIKCTTGLEKALINAGTYNIKNNLMQGNGTDYIDGGGTGTVNTAKNITEDASGPDAAYDNTDVHTNSVFKDYANDDYRLDSGGDATNLAIVDDGDDLSGTFTDDIQGQTRSTWYIGASEIVAAGGAPPAQLIIISGLLRSWPLIFPVALIKNLSMKRRNFFNPLNWIRKK